MTMPTQLGGFAGKRVQASCGSSLCSVIKRLRTTVQCYAASALEEVGLCTIDKG